MNTTITLTADQRARRFNTLQRELDELDAAIASTAMGRTTSLDDRKYRQSLEKEFALRASRQDVLAEMAAMLPR